MTLAMMTKGATRISSALIEEVSTRVFVEPADACAMPAEIAVIEQITATTKTIRRAPDAESVTKRVTDSMMIVTKGPKRPAGEIPMKKYVTNSSSSTRLNR